MTENATNILWSKWRYLDPAEKSRPAALTDVFVAKARQLLIDDSEIATEAFDEIVNLSFDAGISRRELSFCLEIMEEVGSITNDQQDKLLNRIPLVQE